MDYTVTVRDDNDVKTLEAWAEAEERDPKHQLNYEIRRLLQQRARAGTATTPPSTTDRRRGPRGRRALAENGTVPVSVGD